MTVNAAPRRARQSLRTPVRVALRLAVAVVAFAASAAAPLAAQDAHSPQTGGAKASTGATSGAFAQYPAGLSGDFVVYRDWSWEKPTWVGFLYYNDSTWGAFVKSPASGADVRLLFSTETLDGKLVLTGQNIVSKITQDDVLSVNYLMKLLPLFHEWRNGDASSAAFAAKESGRSTLLPPIATLAASDAMFGGAVTVTFAPEVPVFGLRALDGAGGKRIMTLERVGRVKSSDAEFFSFVAPGEPKAGASLSLDAKRVAEKRVVDGVSLSLDGQWTMYADNMFFLGNSAALIVDTLDLSLMQIPRENLPLSLVRMFSLSSAESWAEPSSLSVAGTASRFTVTNLIFDSARGSLNRDIKTCVVSKDGASCVVISLSVSETAYQANKAYFSSLY